MPFNETFDVVVLGGGNAALCAAIVAARRGARVIVLEGAPRFYRGGNTRHTRNLRCSHDGTAPTMTGPYEQQEFLDDLYRVTGGQTDKVLAEMTVARSRELIGFMAEQGVRFQPPLGGTLSLGKTNAFFLGGGRGMLNTLYRRAESLGVTCLFDAPVIGLDVQDGFFVSATIAYEGREQHVRGRALVAACGGFEANIEWLKQYWGEAAENFIIRGTPYNRGAVLRMLLDKGVAPVGDPTQCHAVAIDARAPKYDGGIATRLDSVVFGIMVNRDAKRFYDEGEDTWPKRYAIWGRLVAQEPGQIAYSIVDAKSFHMFMPSIFPAISAPTIAELAVKLSLDPAALVKTVDEFNAAVKPGTFDHTVLDDCRTEGLTPNKTHWARKL
ncbi:MAG TPA: FAD-dependent tricarballylate dehydrogenase TcuA, partial [Pseudolabrys sp.]|nr:FAD-dependent tricarballylate dehydrogenase TcuA [Pseudolabrys sp.]